MSAEIKTLTKLPEAVVSEVKSQAKPATESGVVSQAVGFAVGIPLSMFYDWIYELVAEKAITNDIARDLIKIAVPLGIGVVVHFAKLPFGNYIAGTGYAIALITAGRIIYYRIKGYIDEPAATGATATTNSTNTESDQWGVQN